MCWKEEDFVETKRILQNINEGLKTKEEDLNNWPMLENIFQGIYFIFNLFWKLTTFVLVCVGAFIFIVGDLLFNYHQKTKCQKTKELQ
jgi:hypothetical protein